MLVVFLASEGVKNYQKNYSWLMLALGCGQIVRIFIYPAQAHSAAVNGAQVIGDGQFIRMVIYLSLSAACLFAGAAVNWRKTRALEAHIASVEAAKA